MLTTAAVSLTGDRTLNQDRYGVFQAGDAFLLLVADGMGGHPRGETAAELVVAYAAERMQTTPLGEPKALLRTLVTEGHQRIQTFGQSQKPSIQPGTTLVAALVEADRIHWIHAGDSRLYRWQGENFNWTRDHSYIRELVDKGVLSEQEASNHPMRNCVTECLGGSGPEPNATYGSAPGLAPGDGLLLCSDGFWSNLTTDEIRRLLIGRDLPLQKALERLADRAAANGHPRCDNVTAVAIHAPGTTEG